MRRKGVAVETATATGHVPTEIMRLAHEYGADLLVMSAHGRSGPGPLLYGSVADEVLRRADIPIMLLTPCAKTALSTTRAPRILVPLDDSRMGEAALGPARDWAMRLGAELILLNVVFWPAPIYGDDAESLGLDPTEELRRARKYLHDVATRWRSDAVPIRCLALLGRPIPSEIKEVVSEEQIDLIAIATHGRSGVARLVLGSVATDTLQGAAVPVLLVREGAAGSDSGHPTDCLEGGDGSRCFEPCCGLRTLHPKASTASARFAELTDHVESSA